MASKCKETLGLLQRILNSKVGNEKLTSDCVFCWIHSVVYSLLFLYIILLFNCEHFV